jgi:hypothetical protein
MNKFLIAVVIAGGFVVLYGVGRMWNLKPETKYARTLHRGDAAVLVGAEDKQVWLVRRKEDSYAVQIAMGKNDVEWLKRAATAVPGGTRVKVLREAESAREVEVLAGPQAGQKGWVEQELVRPPRQGEMR